MARTFQVGDTFTHVRQCDRLRPVYYAGSSGDYNPIHIDPEVGKLAAHSGRTGQDGPGASGPARGRARSAGGQPRSARHAGDG
ncbi:hypothetical protein HPP06_41400, partial [Corallococcus exiguus]|nr:hypothetical protein [Corallococcus exiguus]